MKNLTYVFLLLSGGSCFFNCKPQVASKTVSTQVTSSLNNNPNFEFMDESYGCESFTVYKFNKDKTIALWVNGENEKLNLSKTPQVFEFGKEDIIYALSLIHI